MGPSLNWLGNMSILSKAHGVSAPKNKAAKKPAKIAPKHFGALDGFRGLLAILVAVYHTDWGNRVNDWALFQNGQTLLDLFFVFSGFLMFTLYDGRLNSIDDSRKFIKRRFARLYPLHFFMLLVALLYSVARVLAHTSGFADLDPGEILPFQAGADENMGSFLANLFMVHSMGVTDSLSFNMPSWTISVEFFTYFAFVGLMLWARPTKNWHFALISVAVGINYYVLSLIKPNIDFHYDLGFWRCMGGFFTGLLGAYLYRTIRPSYDRLLAKPVAKTGGYKVVALLLEIALIIMMFSFVMNFTGKAQFMIAPVALVFVLGFAFDLGLISKFLSLPVFQYIAKISYSIYMVHILFALFFGIFAHHVLPMFVGDAWNDSKIWGDLMLLPYIITVVVASHFTFKYVEVPGGKAIRDYEVRVKIGKILPFLASNKA